MSVRSVAKAKKKDDRRFWMWIAFTVTVIVALLWWLWPQEEEDVLIQPSEVRESRQPNYLTDFYSGPVKEYADKNGMFDKQKPNVITVPSLNGEDNQPKERTSPEQPIILKKSWMEFYTEIADAGNPALCDTGKDYVSNWNDDLLIRCRAIAAGMPEYCSYYDKQPNAKMDSIMFQQVCMYDVFRYHSNRTKFSPQACESMQKYPAFMSIYLECRAIISHDANYCMQLVDMSPVGQIDVGPDPALRCLSTLANYLQSKELCKVAREYEAYYLEQRRLEQTLDDVLYVCPGMF